MASLFFGHLFYASDHIRFFVAWTRCVRPGSCLRLSSIPGRTQRVQATLGGFGQNESSQCLTHTITKRGSLKQFVTSHLAEQSAFQ